MLTIEHQNVLKCIEFSQNAHDFTDKDGYTQEKVNYLVTELAAEGELFDWIAAGGRFEEPLARLFFNQMISGIKACHDTDFVHRDLKPENILLDKDFVLKVADFGLTGPVSGRDNSGLLMTKKGTPGYCAPEIYETEQKYEGAPADVFSAGVILFMMLMRATPFG